MTREPPGQILPNSRFGKLLTMLAQQAMTIVEIGTWRGGGSTLCLANGLRWQKGARMWTYEIDQHRWNEAQAYALPGVTYIHGHATLKNVPAQIDLLLLDGGEDTTDSDYDLLSPRAKIIALDDACTRKNQRQMKLMQDAGWTLLHYAPEDRNGWAVFQRA